MQDKSLTTQVTSQVSKPENQLVHQLNRIRGQVDGVSKMIEEERDCLDIVQQILAVRSALSSVGKTFLTKEASRCSRSVANRVKLDTILKQLFTLE